MKKEVSISIPSNALVRCPKHGYSMVRVISCTECSSHKGFAERISGDVDFNKKYLNLCDYEPVKREIYELK